jgi:hypothetical protein
MKTKENKKFIEIDLKKLKAARTDKEINSLERMAFVKFWANYVKTHKDEEWSEQQNLLINSQLA